MSNPLEDLTEIEYLIRQLYKIDSKLEAGKFIQAYRENRRIIARLESHKKKIIENSSSPDYLV